jgi:hypothetical protein
MLVNPNTRCRGYWAEEYYIIIDQALQDAWLDPAFAAAAALATECCALGSPLAQT